MFCHRARHSVHSQHGGLGAQLDLVKHCGNWLLSLSAVGPEAASAVQDCPGHARPYFVTRG